MRSFFASMWWWPHLRRLSGAFTGLVCVQSVACHLWYMSVWLFGVAQQRVAVPPSPQALSPPPSPPPALPLPAAISRTAPHTTPSTTAVTFATATVPRTTRKCCWSRVCVPLFGQLSVAHLVHVRWLPWLAVAARLPCPLSARNRRHPRAARQWVSFRNAQANMATEGRPVLAPRRLRLQQQRLLRRRRRPLPRLHRLHRLHHVVQWLPKQCRCKNMVRDVSFMQLHPVRRRPRHHRRRRLLLLPAPAHPCRLSSA